jgi:hypothetical protein
MKLTAHAEYRLEQRFNIVNSKGIIKLIINPNYYQLASVHRDIKDRISTEVREIIFHEQRIRCVIKANTVVTVIKPNKKIKHVCNVLTKTRKELYNLINNREES